MDSQQMELVRQKTLELRNDELIEAFNTVKNDDSKIIPEHQKKYIETLLTSRFIAPVELKDTEDGSDKLNVRFSNLKNKEGKSYIMVFSDAQTMQKSIKNFDDVQLLGVTVVDLIQLVTTPGSHSSGFVINPFTENIITGKDQIENIRKYVLAKNVEEGRTSVISEVEDLPRDISDRLESYFNKRGDIKKAYMFNMSTANKLNRLIVVDILEQSDYGAFVKEFSETVLDPIKDEKIPYIIAPYYDEGAKRATIEKVPFYVKV